MASSPSYRTAATAWPNWSPRSTPTAPRWPVLPHALQAKPNEIPQSDTRGSAGPQHITRENYDSAGRLKQRVYPSGRTITYNFNAAGQINQILTPSSTSVLSAISIPTTWARQD
uniref:RHS repeat domain-containing protein n=1 Tax=Chitinimonas arctica TaxID=2594795 RepID=UPI001CC64037